MRFYVLILFTCICLPLFGQTYGNEWIDYNQKYLSINIIPASIGTNKINGATFEKSRVYLLDYPTLNSALGNISETLNTIDADRFQLFGREKQIPLYIEDGGDGIINDPGDYIMFVASYNDGWLDSTLYNSANEMGNPYYSLYNDTIQYFLTISPTGGNFRYQNSYNTNIGSYVPVDYVLYDHWFANIQEYGDGERLSGVSSSFYTSGEGWSSVKKDIFSSPIFDYSSTVIAHPYQGAGAPEVVFRSLQVGASDASGAPDHHAKWTIGPSNFPIADVTWSGYSPVFIEESFDVNILPSSGASNLKITLINDLGVASDYQRNSFWSVKYPRTPNFDGSDYFELDIQANPTGNMTRIDFSNVSYTNPLVFVQGNEPKRINVNPNGALHTLLITDDFLEQNQHLVFHDSSNVIAISELTPVGKNQDGYFTDFSNTDFEAALLMIYNELLETSSVEYFNYRDSTHANPILINVKELYQQFGGGIEKHINGIRRFGHFAYNNSSIKPVGLFLLGKGIREVNYNENLADGSGYRRNNFFYQQCLIPSFGEPSSDVAITSNLEMANWEPLIPTGRISVQNNYELSSYLSKVRTYENEQDSTDIYNSASKDWQKHIIHFSGGSNAAEASQLESFVNFFKSIIEDSLYAGTVSSLHKYSSSNPITPSNLNSIMDRINNGVSLITYFGHSLTTSSGFEINIDEVNNWENYGKYPVMLVNSCYNGNIFQTTLSSSEKFVREPGKGAIAYLGSVRLGFKNELRWYSSAWYRSVSRLNYGGTLGEHSKFTILDNYIPGNLLYESVMTQMTLNGDPMLRLNSHVAPEIELKEEYISFSPEIITSDVDSIDVNIYIRNLGKSITDSVYIEVTRNFPGTSTDSIYLLFIPKLNYDVNVKLRIPIQAGIGTGINQFTVRVDIPSAFDEVFDESFNNQVTRTLLINIDGIAPVEPYEFAVVPDSLVTVYASTFDPIADQKTYRFEIDTIDFEGAPSNFHRFSLSTGFGGVHEINPNEWISSLSLDSLPLTCTDSTVYFWRVSIDGDTLWRESSFQYIKGKQGWGQDHFFQFKNNGYYGLIYNRPSGTRDLVPYQRSIFCDVYSTQSNPGYLSNAWYLDGIQRSYGICTTAKKFHVVVIDPTSLEPWKTRNIGLSVNLDNDFGNDNDNGACHQVMDFFTFRQDNAIQLDSFINMINYKVPDSHYVLIYSPMRTLWSTMQTLDSAGVFGLFESLGSTMAISGQVEGPMAFFCKKGDPNSVIESFPSTINDNIQLSALIETSGLGREKGPLIGPSTSWNNMYWKQDPLEGGSSSDSVTLSIHAYDLNQNWQFQVDTNFTLNDSILNLNGIIDASLYPYISFEATMMDTLNSSAAQIDRWHVLFDPLPEAAIDGSSGHLWTISDSIQAGDSAQFAVDVRNIFNLHMDSLLINYWLTDENQKIYTIEYPRQDSLRVGEIIRDTISFSTKKLSGWSSLNMEVNPYINGSLIIPDQPEQIHFNNILQIPFFVSVDEENPLLDVTFNGRRILNGDIIAPSSDIIITLKDENEFLIMDEPDDTSNFGIYLTDPNGIQRKIHFSDINGNSIMDWYPADAQSKRFKIIWPADFDLEGEYELYVQGEDKSGNISGDIEYRVTFNVIMESAITQMMNYPNPFSTSTRFVFTLTGNEVPDDIIIQIMTVSGRVVREITEDELGPLYIGRNITEFAWDGTDEFGDQLANGVYLYRVKARLNGEDIKRLESGADQYFTKEFGKMYLLR